MENAKTLEVRSKTTEIVVIILVSDILVSLEDNATKADKNVFTHLHMYDSTSFLNRST